MKLKKRELRSIAWGLPAMCAFLAPFMSGCAQQPDDKSAVAMTDVVATPKSIAVAKTQQANVSDPTCRSSLTFIAATVYAGSTDYFFEDENKVEISFRVENGVTRAKGFEILVTMGDEGPPDTSQELVGKKFVVCDKVGSISASLQTQ